jgi:hypothetical protein
MTESIVKHCMCMCENSNCYHGSNACHHIVDQDQYGMEFIGDDVCQSCVDTMRLHHEEWVYVR